MELFKNISRRSTEKDIEQKLIIPLLKSWGYQESDWQREVWLGRKRADFILCLPNQTPFQIPYLVIEVKAPRCQLNNQVWQLHDYLRHSQALFGLLTNGLEFQLFYQNHQEIISLCRYNQQEFADNLQRLRIVLGRPTSIQVSQYLQKTRIAFHQQVMMNLYKFFPASALTPPNPMTANAPSPTAPTSAIITTVFNNKGGVGKTTTTINMAAALSHLGKRVLLIDIDPQANLTTGLGIDPLLDVEQQDKKDITHLLTENSVNVADTIISKRWNKIVLDIVPSHIRLSDMEATLIQIIDVDRVLAKKLSKIRANYDYIFIDPPPSFGKVNTISLMASDNVLIPTQLAPYPIRALEYVMNRIMAIRAARDGQLNVLGLAVSMYNRSATKQAYEMLQEMNRILNHHPLGAMVPVFPENTWIPQRNIVANTPGKGYPLAWAEYDSNLSTSEKEAALDAFNAYLELAKYVIQLTTP
ncbi:AAA family ATPase [Synechococcus sp. C9]|uniref:AAA family ATPase n=1 Tax=Synechococcus sp. C9 TaxID=102119 RepID=UPI001FF4A98F|nr:AAA family ATPase [Synechococcus sp. C9]